MEIRILKEAQDLAIYEAWLKEQPQASLWQSIEWRAFEKAAGRSVRVYAVMEGGVIHASAMVVIDRTAFRFSTWDIPRGPLWNNEAALDNLLKQVHIDAKRDKCMAIYLSPINKLPSFALSTSHLALSSRHEQPEATRIVDLTPDDDTILAQMHQKGRYNIKVAEKHDVTVQASDDPLLFADLLKRTGERDGFVGPPRSRVQTILEALSGSFLLLAHAPGVSEPVAGLLGVTSGRTAIYYYGASSYEHRSLMAPYLLQWEAMKFAKARGCTRYDLLGIAPPDASKDHPWAGISGFKEKFGGEVITYPREQEIRLKPIVKTLLSLKRRIAG